jgi:hypothetical protein
MKPPIQLDKQYEYRQGGRARILCVDGNSDFHPVISMDDKGQCFSHTPEGIGHAMNRNLIEVVPLWEGEVWVNGSGDIREADYFLDCESEGMQRDGWRKIKVKQEDPT